MGSPSLLPLRADSLHAHAATTPAQDANRPDGVLGATQTGADLAIPPPTACSFPFPSMAPRSCRIGPCRRKYDPSRGGVGSVPGRPAGGQGDRAVPPGFAGVAGWPAAAVPALLSFGTCPRSSDAPDSRNCRCKTPTRNPASGKTTAVTPLLWPSHPARGWNNGPLSWHAGYAVVLCPLTGAAIKKPRSLARSGVSLSTFGPALPEPRPTSVTMRTQSLAIGAHPKNRGFQCVSTLGRSSSRQHALLS